MAMTTNDGAAGRSRRERASLALAVAAALSFVGGEARAVAPDPQLEHGLVAASGAPLRGVRLTTVEVPPAARGAWARMRADAPGSWLALWDEVTGVPLRVWGAGIESPGAIASSAAAERHARSWLARHIELFAPGSRAGDFTLAANERYATPGGDLRVVAFSQSRRGVPVAGGQLSFRFKHDRLIAIASEALPFVSAPGPKVVSDEAARARAARWIGETGARVVEVGDAEEPLLLPLVGPARVEGYRTVVPVRVRTEQPIGLFTVYLDAASGEPVARRQELRFATGAVLLDAPVRRPTSDRALYPASFLNATIDGETITADAAGTFAIPDGGASTLTIGALNGMRVGVADAAKLAAKTTLQLSPGGTASWSLAETPAGDAQIASYVHAHLGKEHGRRMAPEMEWLTHKLPVTVNIASHCNAFYDGSSINFFAHSGACENTGRLADVVYHELGHGFHHRAVVPGAGAIDDALGEGLADYFAVSLTGDPGMGRGFHYTDEPLRHVDPESIELTWPHHIAWDPHDTGLIIAGALWDLRKRLIDAHGEEHGAALADRLFYLTARTASDIPSTYVEILAADDDDGDLANGTPNACHIAASFTPHGLRVVNIASLDLPARAPGGEEIGLAVGVEGLFADCPDDTVESATLSWRLERMVGSALQPVEMNGPADELTAAIPPQPPGEVVRYSIALRLPEAPAVTFPDNPADPSYQLFVGEVTPLYCTDFESDPKEEGWTHESAASGIDDWQWGAPAGTAESGDPAEAFSGTGVLGNDLGQGAGDGMYEAGQTVWATSPEIDVDGHAHVRLQYRRWLTVQDGYFDRARIYSNGQSVWSSYRSQSQAEARVHHRDREWRFHDVDLSPTVADGKVKVTFELTSDGSVQLGGWTIDDFCVVAYEAPAAEATCGNHLLEVGEQCDDGNTIDGDGCDATCRREPDAPEAEPDSPAVTDEDGCSIRGHRARDLGWQPLVLSGAIAALALRRRRRMKRRC